MDEKFSYKHKHETDADQDHQAYFWLVPLVAHIIF